MSNTCKIVLVGDSGAGKTCIISRFVNDRFDKGQMTTACPSFCTKEINYPKYKKTINLDIWDTAGQEIYRSISKLFYKGAAIGILVYDISNQKSFESIKEYWYKEVMGLSNQDVIIAIVANKSDLYKERKVDKIEGEKFAEENGAIFVSTSAKNGDGIQDLFDSIGRKILNDDFVIVGNEIKDDYEKSKEINEDGGRES